MQGLMSESTGVNHLNRVLLSLILSFALCCYSSTAMSANEDDLVKEEQQYQQLIQNCTTTISDLSWIVYKSAVLRRGYDACLNELKQDKTEQQYHLSVLREFSDSKIWYDSALWLHQAEQYVPAAMQLCKEGSLEAEGVLYRPRLNYPVQASRAEIEGAVSVEAVFDASGFFKEIVVLQGTPERVFDRDTKRYIAKMVLCPSDEDIDFKTTVEYRLEK